MPRSLHGRPIMAASLVASVLLHLGVAALWGWARARDGGAGLRLLMEPEESRRPETRLGIERSRAVTMTWIGFEEATEHQARQSVTEQPSLSMETASGSAVGSAPASPGGGGAPAEASEAAPAGGSWASLAPSPDLSLQASSVRELMRQLLEGSSRAAAVSAAMRAERGDAEADPGGAEVREGPGGAEASEQSEPSDREVDPTSRRRPVRVTPGQTKAAEGLEIKTIKPKWTKLVRAMAMPRNPVVEVTFGPDGRVRLVRFAREDGRTMSSGSREVDDVLLNAIYAWTASGQAIEDLDASDPEAGVTITLEIVLAA